MKVTQELKMALSSVKANKMRSFLTMLGIIIGVMAVTLLVSLVQGATNSITKELSSLGGSNLTCMVTKTTPRITLEEIKALEQEPEIGLVSAYSSGAGVAKAAGKQEDVTVYAISQNYQILNQMEIAQGRCLLDTESEYRLSNCLIGAAVAQNLFGTQKAAGERIRLNGKDFRVVGVLKEEGSAAMNTKDKSVFLPFETGQRLLGLNGVQNFDASAADEHSVERAEQTLNEFLRSRVGKDNYEVFNMGSLMDMITSIYNVLGYLLGGIGGISLLVGGVGIMNIMLVSVTERTREIGIRKAIGAQKSDIIVQFLIESVVLSLMGGFIGLLLSAGILGIVNVFVEDYHFAITFGVAMVAVFFSVGVGVLFGIYPANKAAKLKPIDALRFE
ncbi:MAG: FtsX-like permease family protein [Lachnospiraceae bacterium]|jgi:putative ABC transport system permease protein|nr:FtsX-like permease family protein [Lachnospiraceae bacterium]